MVTPKKILEVCPGCSCLVLIETTGLSSCPRCARPEILPCSICKTIFSPEGCDWLKEVGCSDFPRLAKRDDYMQFFEEED